jgi:hypothetical protein
MLAIVYNIFQGDLFNNCIKLNIDDIYVIKEIIFGIFFGGKNDIVGVLYQGRTDDVAPSCMLNHCPCHNH